MLLQNIQQENKFLLEKLNILENEKSKSLAENEVTINNLAT